MKKLFVVLFVFAIVGGYVFGNDTASLTISGSVDQLFLIDFVEGDGSEVSKTATSVELVDSTSGEVHETVALDVWTWERANSSYKIVFTPVSLTGTGLGTFTYDVDHSTAGVATNGAWNEVSLKNGDYDPVDGEALPLEGSYSGTVTATISAP